MNDRITRALCEDHRRLQQLLKKAQAGERGCYDAFRGGLLRHIGIEEKLLLPALRLRGVDPPGADQLHLDHSALAAMLVPSPSPKLLAAIEDLLSLHDPLEEAPNGLYPLADAVIDDKDELLARIAETPPPPLAAHFDGERTFAAIESLLARAREGRASR